MKRTVVVEVAGEALEALPSHLPQEPRQWFRGMVQPPNELLGLLDVSAIGQLGSALGRVEGR